jgi:hypothetical protein
MSYERQMLQELEMPSRQEVEFALLRALFHHGGTIKEFTSGEDIVEELANNFHLSKEQRNANLITTYRKENRLKKSNLWHRLLFRAADALSKEKLVSRPSQTLELNDRKEWMLTEEGFDKVLNHLRIPLTQKENLHIKSVEVQRVVRRMINKERPINYSPFDTNKPRRIILSEDKVRKRGFRFAITECYDFKCAVCDLKIASPNQAFWEVEAAHIVPFSMNGKDDIWNGLSLCRFHHWAFDSGWFALNDDFSLVLSKRINYIPSEQGVMHNLNLMIELAKEKRKVSLPINENNHPHQQSIIWHRENVFLPLNQGL